MQSLSTQVTQLAGDTKPAGAVHCPWVARSQQSREPVHENLPGEERLLHPLRHFAFIKPGPLCSHDTFLSVSVIYCMPGEED